jgi:hypothetical protein
MGSITGWRKASYSGGNGGGCVEVATTRDAAPVHKSGESILFAVRDSQDPLGPVLYFTEAEWEAFLHGVKDGQFDLEQVGGAFAGAREVQDPA